MTSPSLTIVIPVHNEAGFVTQALERLDEELTGLSFVLYLVENGSVDSTADESDGLAERLSWLRVLRLPAADYGAALRAGFRQADTDWVVAFDIDYFSRRFLDEVLERSGTADIILASKRDPGADDRRGILRRLGTRVFNLLLRGLFGSRVTDTHGMKAVNRKVLDDILPQVKSTEDLFDTELVLRAERVGYRIVEVPAVVEELRPARSSYLKRVPRTLVGLLRLRKLLGRR
jgi:glycosyltransferase involved in cell wall biosynthesis